MGTPSPILRNAEGNHVFWWCPGCNQAHQINHGPGGWGWNGDAEKPTFTPSVLVRAVRRDMDADTLAAWRALDRSELAREINNPRFGTVCHSFVVDGRMQMLSDSTHPLAGQTVDIPPWPRRNESEG